MINFDSFSGELGDMPRKARSDGEAVLSVLREHPRFTVFDVDTPLARTLDRLKDDGRLLYADDEGFPWTRVEVLPEPDPCEPCNATGRIHWFAKNYRICRPCDGHGWTPPGDHDGK